MFRLFFNADKQLRPAEFYFYRITITPWYFCNYRSCGIKSMPDKFIPKQITILWLIKVNWEPKVNHTKIEITVIIPNSIWSWCSHKNDTILWPITQRLYVFTVQILRTWHVLCYKILVSDHVMILHMLWQLSAHNIKTIWHDLTIAMKIRTNDFSQGFTYELINPLWNGSKLSAIPPLPNAH